MLHTDNSTKFADIIAVVDAIHAPQRQPALGGEQKSIAAFNVSFAVD